MPSLLALFLAFAAPASALDSGLRLAPATPGAVRFTVRVPDPQWQPQRSGDDFTQRMVIEGYEGSGVAGAPELPVRTMLVAVPPAGEVRVRAVASETEAIDDRLLSPVPSVDAARRLENRVRDASAYAVSGSAAPVAARLLDVTWMRNQRVARIAIEPVAYEPALRRVTLARRVDVEVAVAVLGDLGEPAESPDPFETVYRRSLLNYDQGRAWRRPSLESLRAATQRAGIAFAPEAALTTPPDTSVFVGRTWVKIAVSRSGFVALNYSRLRGLSLFGAGAAVPMDSLRLFVWPGVTVLPENSYCDSCDYREVAIGIGRDVDPLNPGSATGDGLFSDNSDAFYFFAQGPDGFKSEMDAASPDTAFVTHPYERFNYYYLTIASATKPVGGTPARIGVGSLARTVTPTGTETVANTVDGRVHLEQDLEYWPDAASINSTLVWEKWFWRSLSFGQSFSHSIDLADADTTQPARFRLRQWGLSRNTGLLNCPYPGFDHRLDVSFNDVAFPRREWQGIFSGERSGQTWDTTGVFLKRTGNRMTVAVPSYSVTGGSGCSFFLDRSGLAWYELHYERLLRPAADAIDFTTHPTPGNFRYDVGPFARTPSSFLFDLTQPLSPVLLSGAATLGGPGGDFTLSFADTQTIARRYAVVPESLLLNNLAVLPASALSDAPFTSLTNLRSRTREADYVVLYYDGFQAAAESLATWRSQHLPLMDRPGPYGATAVPISALYDQFSGGRADPGAVRNFLRAASAWSRRPLYVTFLGDASFDFKDITGRAVPGQPACLLPTYENGFDQFGIILRQFATDDWMVNVDDAVRVVPDYLAGRLPANDLSAALAVVTGKVLGYERSAPFGEYRNAVVFFADDDVQGDNCDPLGFTHVKQTDALNTLRTPLHMDRQYVYMHTFPVGPGASRPLARRALIDDLNSGTSILNYVGHGSPFKMSDEGCFLDSDAATLTNGLRLGLLVAASCDVGKFNDPTVQSLGERMFMSAQGGSVGVISATEQALSNQNSFLNGLIYDNLFKRDSVTVLGTFHPSTGQYEMPLSAALLVSKSGQFSANTNSQKYQLMGDPATRLNLPRQWVALSLTDEQGGPVTSFSRGQTIRFQGQVLDREGGSALPVDGVASLLIEDHAPTNSLRGAAADPSCISSFDTLSTSVYRFAAGPIYHGDVALRAGQFSGRFVVPMDATIGARGRVRAYIQGGSSATGLTDGVGAVQLPVDPGSPPEGDEEGPSIELSFLGGATQVRPDATLIVNLADPSGIMTTGHAPQNSIIVTLDENTTSRTDITATFRYAADSYQSGTARFTLPGLTPGPHTVRVSAADNLATGFDAVRHRSSATLAFEVSDSPQLRIVRTFLFPSPVRSGGVGGGGAFVVDAPGDSVNALIRIYTVAGKLVRVLRQMGGIGQLQVPWDGLDAEGEPLAQGTYLYKVYVGVRDADGSSSATQRASAEGRFVVLTP